MQRDRKASINTSINNALVTPDLRRVKYDTSAKKNLKRVGVKSTELTYVSGPQSEED